MLWLNEHCKLCHVRAEMEDARQVNEEISPLPMADAFGLVCLTFRFFFSIKLMCIQIALMMGIYDVYNGNIIE